VQAPFHLIIVPVRVSFQILHTEPAEILLTAPTLDLVTPGFFLIFKVAERALLLVIAQTFFLFLKETLLAFYVLFLTLEAKIFFAEFAEHKLFVLFDVIP
jgi:hypothetical protein